MRFGLNDTNSGAFFHFTEDLCLDSKEVFLNPSSNHILWNRSKKNFLLHCDDKQLNLNPGTFCTLTALNHVSIPKQDSTLTAISFNREFYCLRDHDHEISCNGILFYGAQQLPFFKISKSQLEMFESLVSMFLREFKVQDKVQLEMLVSLLKVMIIQLTRIGRNEIKPLQADPSSIETIRKFNLLVDQNFKTKKMISDYAFELGITPKRLSDLFRKGKLPSPLQIIHDRIVLEAKRLLLFSDKSISQISEELGFEEPSQFGKLFKKVAKDSPSDFKTQSRKN
jgi:AraC family transcriptional regulator, 4-hydroxyphenylacetate 3-monooxygenase operon regulatory protein